MDKNEIIAKLSSGLREKNIFKSSRALVNIMEYFGIDFNDGVNFIDDFKNMCYDRAVDTSGC